MQILSSWDAIKVEETCHEHNGLHFFTTWLGRQKAKRDCNAHEHANSLFQKKKNKTGGVNETLISLPLCILSSTNNSGDDVQKLWRFANIIENNKDQINGTLPQENQNKFSRINEKCNDDVNPEDDVTFARNSPQCDQSSSQYGENSATTMEHTDEKSDERDISTTRHSRDCEFHEQPADDNDMNYGKLESTVYHMNKKLQTLEQKMDAILAFLEQQKSSKEN